MLYVDPCLPSSKAAGFRRDDNVYYFFVSFIRVYLCPSVANFYYIRALALLELFTNY